MAAVHRWLDLRCTMSPTPIEGLSNVVTQVSWRLSTIDDTATNADGTPVESSVYGLTDLGPPDPANFVAAPGGVTDDVVRGWVNTGPGAPEGGWEAQNAASVAEAVAALAGAPQTFLVSPPPAS